ERHLVHPAGRRGQRDSGVLERRSDAVRGTVNGSWLMVNGALHSSFINHKPSTILAKWLTKP
ncbi:MAG TPA: hypothetical protein VIH35_07215, partial [Kiritimatiellia bacterium]